MKSLIFNKLIYVNSPYFVKFSKKVSKAINYAKKELFTLNEINNSDINKYLNGKQLIPFWIVEAVCEINLRNKLIPAKYQYLWYCLHNTKITRKQPSGRIFNTKVNFSTVYLEIDEKIRGIVIKTSKLLNIPQSRLPYLWGNKGSNYLSQGRIPLIAILKICQILNIDCWDLLQNRVLYGKTSRNGQILIPKNDEDIDILILLIWLNTEGHLDLGSTHIEINQQKDKKSLIILRKIFIDKFKLNKSSLIFCKGNRGEDRLIISSSPLRQYLSLRYNLSPGYKTGSIQRLNLKNVSEEDYERLMAAFIQTEGCFSYAYTRNKKRKLPKFEFIVKDRNLCLDCLSILRKLGFNPYYHEEKEIYRIGIYDHKEAIRLINKTRMYLYNDKKLKYLKKVCSNEIGLQKDWFTMWSGDSSTVIDEKIVLRLPKHNH